MDKHAQIVLSDVLFSLVIFLIIFAAFITTWTRLTSRLDDALTFNELELATFQISDLLTKNPGVPNDWETQPQNTTTLGLALQDRTLSPTKVNALTNLTYPALKQLLNVNRYELYILLKQGNTALLEVGNISTKRSVHVRRYVRYAQQQATLDVALSKN